MTPNSDIESVILACDFSQCLVGTENNTLIDVSSSMFDRDTAFEKKKYENSPSAISRVKEDRNIMHTSKS